MEDFNNVSPDIYGEGQKKLLKGGAEMILGVGTQDPETFIKGAIDFGTGLVEWYEEDNISDGEDFDYYSYEITYGTFL